MLLPHNPNAFVRSPLDRAGHRRRDQTWLDAALRSEQTQVVAFNKHRPFLYEQGPGLFVRWLAGHVPAELAAKGSPLLFLGVDQNQAPHFAFEVDDEDRLGDLGQFTDLRAAGPRLPANDLAIIGCAKSIFEWHARHRFCANCGTPSDIVEAGWKRQCPSCEAEHFPRFDPVVIMAPVFGEKVLLGRQRPWPRGMHSALAGFVEPGETIEEAVARETLEEAGLVVREVQLHSTQPWPFPHSLMMGALCFVENDNETIDTTELESGRWFTREEAKLLIAGKHPECWAPPPFAIAHQILKSWSEAT